MGNVSAGKSFQPIFLDSLTEKKRFQIRIADGMPSRFMLQGYVYATRHGLEVVAEVTDVETSRILGAEDARGFWLDIYTESDERSTLASVAGDLSEKFHRAFPLVSGRIAEKLGKNLFRAEMEGGQIRLEWPLLVGSDAKFIANADIDEQRADGVCLIRLANLKCSEPQEGDQVAGE